MSPDHLDTSESRPPPGSSSYQFTFRAKLAVVAGSYFVVGKFGLQFAYLHESASAIWPASGLAFAAILLWGFRLWPAIFVGAFFVNVTTAGNVLTALLIATGNTLEAVAGAWLVCRFANGRHAFAHARDVVRFWFLACMGATLLSSTIGVVSLCLTGFAEWETFTPVWRTWWLGDAVGGFIGASVIVLWVNTPPAPVAFRSMLESLAVFVFLVLMGSLVFSNQLLHQSLSVLPALLWAAFRLGRRETAGAVLIVAVIGTWGTVRGTGPFSNLLTSRNDALLMLQSYIAVLSVSHMTIAAVVAERQRAEMRLRTARDELELRVQDRTALLSSANAALRGEMAERRLAEERLTAVERERADNMRELAAFVQGAQEEERRRLARDLHDDLGQRLAALKLNMHAFEREMAGSSDPRRQHFEQLVGDVDRIIAEVRRLSYNLRPLALDDFGLRVALEMLCKDIERAHGVKTHLRMSGSMPALRESQIDIALYRIAQGALSNVAKHAGAHNVAVSMAGDERSVVMSVEDDGRGFDVASVRKTRERSGLGLISMRERAEMLGGSFAITSSTETGTRVEVVIPVAPVDGDGANRGTRSADANP